MAPRSTRRPAKQVARIGVSQGFVSDDVLLMALDAQGRAMGEMLLSTGSVNAKTFLQVQFAAVKVPGAGVGTKLYEKAARVACQRKQPLMSDTKRTIYSEGFWKKQARKGRATCMVRSGGKRLNDAWNIAGRWSCGRYALVCPAPRSLRGIR